MQKNQERRISPITNSHNYNLAEIIDYAVSFRFETEIGPVVVKKIKFNKYCIRCQLEGSYECWIGQNGGLDFNKVPPLFDNLNEVLQAVRMLENF